jgi:hypothetical protein
MNSAVETKVEMSAPEVCQGAKSDYSRQRRYQEKMKAARRARRKDWQERVMRDRSLGFDGRLQGSRTSGIPRLGSIKLEINHREEKLCPSKS